MTGKQKRNLRRILLAGVLLVAASLIPREIFLQPTWMIQFVDPGQSSAIPPQWAQTGGTIYSFPRLLLFLSPYALVGWDVLWKALRNIKNGQVFDENFLMSVATVGAMAMGEYAEGVAVMLFYQVGELFQSVAVHRSRRSIAQLMDIRPDSANVERDGELCEVDPEEVAVGETIVVKPGERVPLEKRSRDFLFIRRDNPAAIIKDMMVLLRDKLPGYVGAEIQEIQIMTPMRKGALGVEQLNRILQENFNPPAADKPEKEAGGTIFRTGDKVMQIKNNYQLAWEVRNRYGIPVDKGEGVFNGDMGVIRQVNAFSETLEVEFDEGRMVEYSFKQLEELELAYAITIHKSQGSEYPAVVIPIYSGPRMLMTRNLIYTAVTRAKKCVCLVGLPEMFQFMVENEMEQKRYSGLKDRILEIEPGLDK